MNTPTNILPKFGGKQIKQIFCHSYHTTIETDVGIYAFGCNFFGELGNNSKQNSLFPIMIDEFLRWRTETDRIDIYIGEFEFIIPEVAQKCFLEIRIIFFFYGLAHLDNVRKKLRSVSPIEGNTFFFTIEPFTYLHLLIFFFCQSEFSFILFFSAIPSHFSL